jgi:hypothetical protein
VVEGGRVVDVEVANWKVRTNMYAATKWSEKVFFFFSFEC